MEKDLICYFEINEFVYRPTDDGTKMEAPGVLVNAALDYAVTHVTIFFENQILFYFNDSFLGSSW
jgi:hypothetical protein